MSASPNDPNLQTETSMDIEPEHQTVTAIDNSTLERVDNQTAQEQTAQKQTLSEQSAPKKPKEKRKKTYYPTDDDIIDDILAQMVREPERNERVRKDEVSVVDNTVHNDIYIHGTPPQQEAVHERQNIGKTDRTDKNAVTTIQEERNSLRTEYLRDDYRQMYYTDVNLPTDMDFRFNQGLRGSKAFNENAAASLIKTVDMYKKGDADPQQEMMIMYKFGILLKNITDYKRSLIDEKITRGLKTKPFQAIDSWRSEDNFSKTCISYGYVIPNEITVTRVKDSSEKKGQQMMAATVIFKQSMVFPGSNLPEMTGKYRKSYCALAFTYCGYHFVLFSKAHTLRVPFRGSIAEFDNKEVCITDLDNRYVITLNDLVEHDKAAVARQRTTPKMTMAINQDDKTCTASKTTNGRRTTKKATVKKPHVKSYDISSWINKITIKKDDESQTAVVEDTNQMYKDNDSNDNDIDSNIDSTTMIEMYILVRNMATNKTKQLACYVKYRTYGVQIYLAYEDDNVVYFFPIDNSEMEDYSVYWKE